MNKGSITVSDSGISVREIVQNGWAETSFPRTANGLLEAARILAGWMDLPCEDISDECRRIHAREQQDALWRDEIRRAFGEEFDEQG